MDPLILLLRLPLPCLMPAKCDCSQRQDPLCEARFALRLSVVESASVSTHPACLNRRCCCHRCRLQCDRHHGEHKLAVDADGNYLRVVYTAVSAVYEDIVFAGFAEIVSEVPTTL